VVFEELVEVAGGEAGGGGGGGGAGEVRLAVFMLWLGLFLLVGVQGDIAFNTFLVFFLHWRFLNAHALYPRTRFRFRLTPRNTPPRRSRPPTIPILILIPQLPNLKLTRLNIRHQIPRDIQLPLHPPQTLLKDIQTPIQFRLRFNAM
jgi:hypothetical protein